MEKIIYVIDDEANIRNLVGSYLIKEGYRVQTFAGAAEVLEILANKLPDMIILDIMMPGMDGYEFLKRLRLISEIPVIMLSAKDEDIDKILGLELGSDDYLTKPFSPRELMVRIKNVFRRLNKSEHRRPSLQIGNMYIYTEERRVEVAGKELTLTNKEYELLLYLCENCNRVFKREQLLDKIWGYDYVGDIRAVDDLVKRVRKKLKDKEAQLQLKTIWGYGYKVEM